MIRRAWSPQIARAFVGAYIVLSIVGGGLLAISQFSLGDRITRVEHVRTVELCSTTVSCRHLLDELVASIGPRERRLIERHFASAAKEAPGVNHAAAPVPQRRSTRTKPGNVPRHSKRGAARAPAASPPSPPPITNATPAEVPPPLAAVPAPAPAVPAPRLPSLPPQAELPPLTRTTPLPLPCPRLPVVERLLCR